MQTFLPLPGFDESARALDMRRLGKQRVEAYQILRTLRGESSGWSSHPAVKMWRGHERALAVYMRAMILEWIRRGYRNTMPVPDADDGAPMPAWLGDERLHASHRSNLKRKAPDHYGHWPEPDHLPYVWPVG